MPVSETENEAVAMGGRAWLANEMCTFFSCANINIRLKAGGILIFAGYLLEKTCDIAILNQIYRTASETSPGHTRSQHSRLAPGDLDHRIELTTANLVIIAQRYMRFLHQAAKSDQIACLESLYRIQYALVLANDVSAAAPYRLI